MDQLIGRVFGVRLCASRVACAAQRQTGMARTGSRITCHQNAGGLEFAAVQSCQGIGNASNRHLRREALEQQAERRGQLVGAGRFDDTPSLAGPQRSLAHGIGMVGGCRCRSWRLSAGRSLYQVTNRVSCLTASS